MYGFVDTIAGSGTGSTSLSLQTVFNGNNLDQLLTDDNGSFITLTVTGRSNLTQRVQTTEVPGMDGLLEQTDPTVSEREITIKYKIEDKTNEGFRRRYDRLLSYLGGSKKVLSFTDEDALFYATLLTNETPEEETNNLIGTITFLCSDPFKYGKEQTKTFTSDVLNLTYDGTAEASPIFELEVLKPVTFAMVQNQFEEYQLIGTPLEADMETVDTRKLLIEERGETLDTWSNTPTKVDGGVVAGRLSTDNDGITVPSYGPDTNNWHGPALIKEISPSQDFEIEMMVEGETGKPDQTYRIEFYAYDENMNVLGKMALLDKSLGINNKIAEGRIGGYEGRQKNYLISSQNYSYGWPFFFGMLRLRRIGNQFEFYVTRVANNTKHVFSLKKLFTDNNNEYMGKLRYVQIHIGKWADSARAYAPKILHIKVFKLAQETVDQTPYIANPGDKITLDNFNKEILLNGEDSKNLKDFGGSFFNLHKGDNQLVVHPSNSFKATAKWRNRYR
ncbi:distal tail protein Dit [Virgibacillus proomii]|uniref:distal tail protein Dit n=1 Tax=Virgibacillus proomii TaxID=84407 RepID=UPI00098515AA|nr:distal tail protein Dit [Virgibacillus proomii]